ncbi:hypothetical protein BQ8420_03605 [Nocardiopsis sp. JB363]|nr:hypothetical protein BQ8420_03605 [Nocardiopsis sp. JB363]
MDIIAGAAYVDSTRSLRSAVWSSTDLRDDIIRERVEHHQRVPAREPGLASGRVVNEAVRARQVLALGGLWAAVVLVICFVFNAIASLAALTVIVVLRNLAWIRTTPELGWTSRIPRLGLHGLLFVLVWQMVLALAVTDALTNASSSGGDLFAGDDPFAGDQGSGESSAAVFRLFPLWVSALLLLSAMVAISYWARHRTNAALLNIRLRSNETAPGSGVGSRPVSFYTDFNPFLGSGVRWDSWPLTLKLFPSEDGPDRSATTGGVDPVERNLLVTRMYERLRGELPTLGGDSAHLGGHRTVEVTDSVFLSGIRKDNAWDLIPGLLDEQRGNLHPAWAGTFAFAEHERARHFLTAGVRMWEGQVVLTVFVRLTVRGGQLRIEGESLVMPPIAPEYQAPTGPLPTGGNLEEVWELLSASTRHCVTDSDRLLAEGVTWLRSRRRTRRNNREYTWAAEQGELFDYAPRLGIRERAANDELSQLFQSHDIHRFHRAIREKVMTCVRDVLIESGYDTEQIKQVLQQFNHYGHQVHGDMHDGGGNQFGPNPTKSSGG